MARELGLQMFANPAIQQPGPLTIVRNQWVVSDLVQSLLRSFDPLNDRVLGDRDLIPYEEWVLRPILQLQPLQMLSVVLVIRILVVLQNGFSVSVVRRDDRLVL